MRLITSEIGHINRLVCLSKAAFDSDVSVGAPCPDGPPGYDCEAWHIDMMNQGHLFTALEGDDIIGGAVLFRDQSAQFFLYIGRIFIDPSLFGRGYGMRLMELIENMYPEIAVFCLDTPVWNTRTNRFYRKIGYTETRRDDEMVCYRKEIPMRTRLF